MSKVKPAASDPDFKPAETQSKSTVSTPQAAANAPSRPERPASRSLNRPLILKHRKLRPVFPPTIVRRRSPGQTKKTTDLRRAQTSIGETPSTLTSAVGPDESATQIEPLREVPALSTNPGNRPNSLQMRGNYWEICYENRSAIIDDSRGLRYMALLIQQTGENKGPLLATELVALAKGAGNVLVELASKDPVIDVIAENQITKRLEQIAFERNDACARRDYDRVADLDAEVDEITAEFERLNGRGRKKATFNNDGEKARKAVSKAIADTLAKLGSLPEMEPLAKHLTEAIRKGQWLSYNGNIEWKIDFSVT